MTAFLTTSPGKTLKYQTSPTATPLKLTATKLRADMIVMSPGEPVNIENPLGEVKSQKYIQVTKVLQDQGREYFWGNLLTTYQGRTTHAALTATGKRSPVTEAQGTFWRLPTKTQIKQCQQIDKEYASNVTPIAPKWILMGGAQGRLTRVLLPTTEEKVTMTAHTVTGPITPAQVRAANTKIMGRLYMENGEVFSDSEEDEEICQICSLPVTEKYKQTCQTAEKCTGYYHKQCIAPTPPVP